MSTTPSTSRYRNLRSVIESPVLDEHKFNKLPGIPADGVLVDMEDSVPPTRKEEGRARVLERLADREFFGARVVIGRPNHIATPWGYEDIIGLARIGIECMMYPKARSVGEVLQVQRLLREHGADPDLVICIETPQAVVEVEAIAAVDKVVGLAFGEGDLTAEMGIPIYLPDRRLNPALNYPRMRTIMAAHASEIAAFEAGFSRNIRDLDECRARCAELVALGATGLVAIYPPHVDVHLSIFTPSPDEVDRARIVVAAMADAVEAGHPAVQLDDGRTLFVHDLTKARRVLARAGVADGS